MHHEAQPHQTGLRAITDPVVAMTAVLTEIRMDLVRSAYVLWALLAVMGVPLTAVAQDSPDSTQPPQEIRLGIIGLDTSHVVAFTSYINKPANKTGCKVVAAFAGGSPDFPASTDRVPKFTKTLQERYDVQLVDSVEELCRQVDGVLLESLDGRVHLDQAKTVIAAGKPFFIDKPVAHNLETAIEIFRLAREKGIPCWSSSAFRYSDGVAGARENPALGKIVGCDVFGSSSWTQFHPDLYLYGIHPVEALFTVMGPGCRSVQRVKTQHSDLVIGIWEGGRIGTFRDLKNGKTPGMAVIFGTESSVVGKSAGYDPLLVEIVKFFHTGVPPVSPEETIEIYAFMSAADRSREQGGTPVSLEELLREAKGQ